MNSANACWVHSISIDGLQPWLADKSSLDIERRVSISLVPKCSGVSPSSVWRQGLNAESSPLLQRLLMHFASGSHWSKPEVQFGKGARTDFFFVVLAFFLFASVLQSQSIVADFGSHVPVEKGPTSASSLVSYWEKGAMGLLATLNQGRSVYLEALCKPSLARSSGQYKPCPDRPVSVSVVNRGPILGFVPAAFEALQGTMKQRG